MHRGVTVGIGTGIGRGDVVAVSLLQTTMRVGAIRGASGGGVSCCALGVESIVLGVREVFTVFVSFDFCL